MQKNPQRERTGPSTGTGIKTRTKIRKRGMTIQNNKRP
jgi:hypothetical protein